MEDAVFKIVLQNLPYYRSGMLPTIGNTGESVSTGYQLNYLCTLLIIYNQSQNWLTVLHWVLHLEQVK